MMPHLTGCEPLTLGVLGGLGPEATLHFLGRLVALTPARIDQDHIHVIADINPKVPDRNAAIAGTGCSAGPALAAMARRLEQAGAHCLVMPCNTAHAFEDDIRAATQLPFISIVEETCAAIRQSFPAARSIGILATQGCLDARLYEVAAAAQGIRLLTPSADEQRACMQLIYAIKNGGTGAQERAQARHLGEQLIARGAELVVAGCTEMPLVIDQGDLSRPLLDSVEVLAQRCVDYALRRAALPARR